MLSVPCSRLRLSPFFFHFLLDPISCISASRSYTVQSDGTVVASSQTENARGGKSRRDSHVPAADQIEIPQTSGTGFSFRKLWAFAGE